MQTEDTRNPVAIIETWEHDVDMVLPLPPWHLIQRHPTHFGLAIR